MGEAKPIVAIASPRHPLATRRSIRPAELAGQEIILRLELIAHQSNLSFSLD